MQNFRLDTRLPDAGARVGAEENKSRKVEASKDGHQAAPDTSI
jgi:hypothetical protein